MLEIQRRIEGYSHHQIRVLYGGEVASEPRVGEKPTIREHVETSTGQVPLTSLQEPQEVAPEESRLSSRYAQLGGFGWDQLDQAEVLLDAMAIINRLRWLRAHHTVAVAPVGCENRVVRRPYLEERPHQPSWVEDNNVFVLEVVSVG